MASTLQRTAANVVFKFVIGQHAFLCYPPLTVVILADNELDTVGGGGAIGAGDGLNG